MALFQKPPSNQEEYELYQPLDIPPDQVLEMDEDEWYEKVYRGESFPQLTWRAVLVGSVLGFLLAFTNLYIGLKTGWALGVAITACILSYALWSFLIEIRLAKSQMTILETNCMQSTASAAGYSTGGTMVSAVSALLIIQGHHMPIVALVLWTLFLAALGTLLAIPMKRNMINQERLKFPSGTAAAVTLQSLYSTGSVAMKKAKALMWSATAGAIVPLLIDLQFRFKAADGTDSPHALLPGTSNMFDGFLPSIGTHVDANTGQTVASKPSDWTLVMDHNPVMIAAGALVGMRIATYMLLASFALYLFIGPAGRVDLWLSPQSGTEIAAVTHPSQAWKQSGLWLGVAIMVSSGILAFLLQWKTIARALSGIGKLGGGPQDQLRAQTEAPFSWFAIGVCVFGAGVIWVAHHWFGIHWGYGILAVGLTFVLSLVACRATGESDITPVGAMGKIMQLTFGTLIPQNNAANLMTASITASAAGSSADLLNDLKSGYLLGANPRRQFIAQFIGIFAGTAATVIGFRLLVPDAATLTDAGTNYPAPAAQAWAAVARIFETGIENMHPTHVHLVYWGLGIGAVCVILEAIFDALGKKEFKPWLPSATGLGLGLILPFQYPFSMFLGALIAWIWTKKGKKSSETYMIPIAAGIIAGVSIMGVIVALINTRI